jgi:hypothetical protein
MVKARTWSEIKSDYEKFQSPLKGMVELVERLETSRYASGVWAWTSMTDLCLAQMPIIDDPYSAPYLKISPHLNGNVEFRYLDTHVGSRQWHRVVSEAEAFSRLEKFFEQLHWFGHRP